MEFGHVGIAHADLSRVLQGASRRDAKAAFGWLLNMRKGNPGAVLLTAILTAVAIWVTMVRRHHTRNRSLNRCLQARCEIDSTNEVLLHGIFHNSYGAS